MHAIDSDDALLTLVLMAPKIKLNSCDTEKRTSQYNVVVRPTIPGGVGAKLGARDPGCYELGPASQDPFVKTVK